MEKLTHLHSEEGNLTERLTVTECKFVCPMHSEAKQIKMSVLGTERGLLQDQERRALVLENPELPDSLDAEVFIGKILGEGCRI